MPTTHHSPNVLLPHHRHDYSGTTDCGRPSPSLAEFAMDTTPWTAGGEVEDEEEEEVYAEEEATLTATSQRKNVSFHGGCQGGTTAARGGGQEEEEVGAMSRQDAHFSTKRKRKNENEEKEEEEEAADKGADAALLGGPRTALTRAPRRGILKRLRVTPELHNDEGGPPQVGTAWSCSLLAQNEEEGNVANEQQQQQQQDTSEETENGEAMQGGQGCQTLKTSAVYMDDAQALAFLTSAAVLAEWPFMSDIHFLVTVITDMRLPDYPVIYASDSFEGLTLYEKSDILGSNCRILQGKCTNKQTVEMLRTAIHNGEQVEAHLLNYRKDGTPFWNKFMALPIKDRESGVVTHYVGIQQDVTLLTEMGSDPRQWMSPEVGMWLDHVDLGDYSLKAVQQDIVGADLFSEEFESLALKLEMTNEQDVEYLRRKVKRLKRNPQLSFSSSFSSFDFSHSAISLHLLSQTGPKKVRFDPKTFYHPDAQDKVTVRCFYRDRLHLFSIHKNTSFSRLRNKIKSILPRLKYSIQQIYEDPEFISGSATAIHSRGNVEARRLAIFAIRSDEELSQAITRVTGARSHLQGGAPVMRIRLMPVSEGGEDQLLGPPLSAPFSFSLTSASSSSVSSSSSSLSSSMSSLLEPSTSLLSTSSFFSASLPGTSRSSSVLPSLEHHRDHS